MFYDTFWRLNCYFELITQLWHKFSLQSCLNLSQQYRIWVNKLRPRTHRRWLSSNCQSIYWIYWILNLKHWVILNEHIHFGDFFEYIYWMRKCWNSCVELKWNRKKLFKSDKRNVVCSCFLFKTPCILSTNLFQKLRK